MRSKKKKLLFICFSALIMVGLCIGVFADYNDDRLGTVVGSTPYDLGEKVYDFDDVSSGTPVSVDAGYYIVKITVPSVIPSDDYHYIVYGSTYFVISRLDNTVYVHYNYPESGVVVLDGGYTYYIYCRMIQSAELSKTESYEFGYSVEFYSINDEYTIDIYDNSQDVWASVASIVDDATDSVINNDILLMFAAAIPVLSFGVGMLIRLFHKS